MDSIDDLAGGVRVLRPFLPSQDFDISLRFYEAVGFKTHRLGDTLAEMRLGAHAFLLQGYYVKDWADNAVMHVLVDDVQAWWRRLQALDLAARFGSRPITPPRVEPWGLEVLYLIDPAGVLWHFAEPVKADALAATGQ